MTQEASRDQAQENHTIQVRVQVVTHIATIVRTAHPQLRKSLDKTLTVVGLAQEVVAVWTQLHLDTILLPTVCWYLIG